MSAEAPAARFGPWRREALAFVELFALTGIAVAQPVFDLLGKNASELVANGRTRPQIVVMTILVLIVPPTLAWLAEVAIGIVAPGLRRYAHAAIAAVIVGTIAVAAFKQQTEWGPLVLLGLSAVLGVGGGLLILRFDLARTFLRYLAFAPVAFAILFVFFSPVSTVLFPDESGAADVKIGSPDRVVMVVMDELPVESLLDGEGRIDAELFPNFARLADESTWYRNNTTVSPFTETAVPALLSGDLTSDEQALPVASEYPNTLFTLLGDRYEMNVHETLTQLCPQRVCARIGRAVAHRGLRGFLRDTAELWRDFASPTRQTAKDEAAAFDLRDEGAAQLAGGPFIRSLRPTNGPELDFLHVMLPHQGWHLLGTGQDNAATFETAQVLDADGIAVWPTGWLASVGRQKHLLQLQYADLLLGRIIAKLERIDAWDDSLVIVTADHGAAFTAAEPVRGVSSRNFRQIMWTPLFVKTPGQSTGTVNDQPVRSLDVLPTVADMLDVQLPWKVDGRSAIGAPRTDEDVRILRWEQSTLTPPPGSKYNTLDGAQGFAEVLRGRAAPAGGDPALRLYRLGPFGALVGTVAAPLVRAATTGPTAAVRDRAKFATVDPTARLVPWTWIAGSISGATPGRSVAITVNGVIAGISEVSREDGDNTFWASLPPQLFRPGANDIDVYLIDGAPSSPLLSPVEITG